MRTKFLTAGMAVVALFSLVSMSVKADSYINAVTNTPGLCSFWLLNEPGTPLTSVDMIGGKVAVHKKGFPPVDGAGGPASVAGPRPADGFAGMAADSTALNYLIAQKTRSFVEDPTLLGNNNFTNQEMRGLSMEYWFKRTTLVNEGVIGGYLNATGSRYIFTDYIRGDTNTDVRQYNVFCKSTDDKQTAYILPEITPDLLWHHRVLTWDGRNLRSYIDGYEAPSSIAKAGSGTIGPLAMPDELVFGGDASPLDIRYLNGTLGRMALYDRPLTDAQVTRHYQAAVQGSFQMSFYEQAVLDLKPCHYWRLDQKHGFLLDSIGNWSLAPWGSNHKWSRAGMRPEVFKGLEPDNLAMGFSRDNNNGLFNTNSVIDAFTPTNSFTAGTVDKLSMSVWFRLSETSPANRRQVVAGLQNKTGNRYTIILHRESNGNLVCFVTDNSGESQLGAQPYTGITDSLWHHFVLTWDGSTLRTYLDGANEKSFTNPNVSGGIRASDGFYVGMDANNSNYFDGEIDEVALFNYALSSEQVTQLHKAAMRGKIRPGTVIMLTQGGKGAPINMPARGVCAHRGAMATHPENTLAAFQEAIRLGAHMIELDINLTSDDQIVLMHDATVDRTTNGTGRIADLTFAQIRALDAGSWKDARFTGEKIPTLEEALAIMPQNVWLNVHAKNDGRLTQLAAQEIARQGRLHQAFLAAERVPATAARQVQPNILICNMEAQSASSAYVSDTIAHGDQFLQLMGRVAAPQDMLRLQEAGVHINCFIGNGKPKTAEEFIMLVEAGVDFPLVDDLEPMLAAAQSIGIEPLRPEFKAHKLANDAHGLQESNSRS